MFCFFIAMLILLEFQFFKEKEKKFLVTCQKRKKIEKLKTFLSIKRSKIYLKSYIFFFFLLRCKRWQFFVPIVVDKNDFVKVGNF